MADLRGFDAQTVEPNDSFDPVPNGDYLCIITTSEMKPTKAGDGAYLELELQVIEGPYQGRKLWDRLNLNNANETTVKIAKGTLRVDYRLGLDYWVSEWICFEHTGWARRKAEQWWKARSPDPVPDTAQHAEDLANNGALAHPERVTVRAVAGEKFERIIGCQLGPKPEPSPLWAVPDLDEVPF